MTLAPGQTIQLTIQDIAFGGEGVARVGALAKVESRESRAEIFSAEAPALDHPRPSTLDNAIVVFVPFVLPGEEVEVEITEIKKRFARARLLRIVKPSPERVSPPCPYFGDCGGCQYQHITYEAQLRLKQKQIADLFERIGGFDGRLVAPVMPCPQPYGYRNRIMIRSQWDKFKQGLNIGFIRYDNRLVVDIEECKIAEPALNEQIKQVRAHPPPKGGLKVVLRIPPDGWEVPPDSFFQNNFFLLPKMAEVVRECLRNAGVQADEPVTPALSPSEGEREKTSPSKSIAPGHEPSEMPRTGSLSPYAGERVRVRGRHLVDVYCGVGFLGIELANLVQSVVGVEYDRNAITAARHNAKARGLTNTEFIAGTAEEKLPELLSLFDPRATTVLLDPPRRGCAPQMLELLRQSRPAQIIYVSCHPATMARDLNVLCREGVFELVQTFPLDMFPQTQHVECVADLRSRPSAEPPK